MDIDAQLKRNALLLERHTKQLKETETCVLEMQKSLAENTASTKRIEASIADLVGWFTAFEGAYKVLNGIGKLAKPMVYILGVMAAISGAWVAVKGYMK